MRSSTSFTVGKLADLITYLGLSVEIRSRKCCWVICIATSYFGTKYSLLTPDYFWLCHDCPISLSSPASRNEQIVQFGFVNTWFMHFHKWLTVGHDANFTIIYDNTNIIFEIIPSTDSMIDLCYFPSSISLSFSKVFPFFCILIRNFKPLPYNWATTAPST